MVDSDMSKWLYTKRLWILYSVPNIFTLFAVNTVPLVILGVAECAVTIMAASIPVLRALLRVNRLPNASEITQGRIPTPTTGSTLGWQDEEAFAKEMESYSPVKISMSRTPTSTTGKSWRI